MNSSSPLYPQPFFNPSPFQYFSFLLSTIAHPYPLTPLHNLSTSFPNTNICNNFFLHNNQFFITNYNPTMNTFSNTSSYTCTNSSKTQSIPLLKEEQLNNDKTPSNKLLLGTKKKRATKMCTACPHKYAIHYAKNMCSNCYHIKGRSKKPWNCTHINKAHYALGLCQNCYQMKYIRKQFENEKEENKGEAVSLSK